MKPWSFFNYLRKLNQVCRLKSIRTISMTMTIAMGNEHPLCLDLASFLIHSDMIDYKIKIVENTKICSRGCICLAVKEKKNQRRVRRRIHRDVGRVQVNLAGDFLIIIEYWLGCLESPYD